MQFTMIDETRGQDRMMRESRERAKCGTRSVTMSARDMFGAVAGG